jgi:hypothetical protein
VGRDLLGLAAGTPQATAGEEDAFWEYGGPRRTITFEVKLAPETRRVVNDDIEQAEGAARAAETTRGCGARGLLVTPHDSVDETAAARLERVRLLNIEILAAQVERILDLLREYRRGWNSDAGLRAERRAAVAGELPPTDWLWRGIERSSIWLDAAALEQAWRSRVSA